MNINIDTDLLDFVTAQATLDGVTPEVWVERKANGAIRRVMKDKVMEQINTAPIEEVKRYLTAVDVVKAEIVAEKEAVKIVDPILEAPTKEATTTEEIIN